MAIRLPGQLLPTHEGRELDCSRVARGDRCGLVDHRSIGEVPIGARRLWRADRFSPRDSPTSLFPLLDRASPSWSSAHAAGVELLLSWARADFRSSRFMRSDFRACSVANGRGRNRRGCCLRSRGHQRLVGDLQRRWTATANPTPGRERRGDDTVRYGTAVARPVHLGVGGRCARSRPGF